MDDERYNDLKREVHNIAKDVSSIRDMLISEPEASPMGRALIARSESNRRTIEQLRIDFEKYKHQQELEFAQFERERFDPLYDWWNRTKGSWQAVLSAAVVLGILATAVSIINLVDQTQ